METTPNPRPSFLTPKSIGIFLAGIILLTLLVVGSLSLINKTSKTTDPNQPDKQSRKAGNLSDHTLVYGTWTEKSSLIMGYDLSTGTAGTIASLPLNIKKVSVLSPTSLLYIADTDIKDHGKSIDTYSIDSKSTQTIYQASDGYFIDDYVISQNKKYIAVWEVQPHPTSGILLGGKSQVYTAEVANPNQKNIIYQEDALISNPVRYPRGILNNGTVFMDRFLPNYVAGWGYGMSVSNFTGTEKKDIDTMQNGTYSTQPILSENGSSMLFSGYDGSKGDGSVLMEGFKRAQLSANTIELLDTTTLQREKLSNIPANNVYPYVVWDGDSSVIYYQVTNPVLGNGLYRYSLSDSKSAKLPTTEMKYFVQSLNQTSVLIGNKQVSSTSIGNLGPTYESPFTDLFISDTANNKDTPLSLDATLIQYIDLLPSGYFADSSFSAPDPKFASANGNNLQIGSFVYKPEIEKERQDEQQDPVEPPKEEQPDPVKPPTSGINKPSPKPANPPAGETIDCQAMARSICKEQHPTDVNARGYCIDDLKPQLKESGQCNASPLYLYGSEGMEVDVTIHTSVSNTYPHQQGKVSLITHTDGTISTNNQNYDSLKFDYISALRRTPKPVTGYVIERKLLTQTLYSISRKLALNEKETNDLIAYGKSVATGNYIFVSFFDHATSHAILPITFNPNPDVYRNMVFYFKNLDQKPNYSVPPPTFDPIKRYGFTAVEISGIVE